MANLRALNNDRSRAARSDADLLGKLDYWRAVLHERGLHTEAMIMARAASEIRILRGQVREHIIMACPSIAEHKPKAQRRSD
jgi:hypothetical protein